MAKLPASGNEGSALDPDGFPTADALAALRASLEGFETRDAVVRFAPNLLDRGVSARGVIGRARRALQRIANERGRPELAELFDAAKTRPGSKRAARVASAIEELQAAQVRVPLLGDAVSAWLSPRTAAALEAAGITTLAALTLRVPRRRQWWSAVPGLGQAGAHAVEAFFASYPELTDRARSLLPQPAATPVVPWEVLDVPADVDGSHGTFRARPATCTLSARNDYEAVQAWIDRHEAPATQRSYRKEAERLILWAVVERGKALSSLTAEDATAYRAFLRRPAPHDRWVGPSCARSSSDWRPFAGPLSAPSAKYALSVLGALFRWLVEQRYVLANPFSGLKVSGGAAAAPLDASRAFSQAEWGLIRVVADGLEWSYGWAAPAARRLRFLLDFCYATGLRASEFTDAVLGQVEIDDRDEAWLHVIGKGKKKGKVAIPPLARGALDRYLLQRGVPTTPARWDPKTHLIGSLDEEGPDGISA